MRHANEKHCVLARLGRRILHGATGMLLEHVVDMLHTRDLPFADAVDAFVEPADCRTESDAVIANLARDFQPLQRCPESIVINLFHANIMELQEIDMIGLESFQRRLGRAHDRLRRKILRYLALSAPAGFTVRDEIVPDLGRDHELIALCRKSFGNEFLAQSISVGIGGIEKRDAKVKRLVHESDGFAFGESSPPTGGNRPKTEPDFAHFEVSVFVSAKAH